MTDKQNTNNTTPVKEDSLLEKKLAELDAEIKKVKELNERMAVKEKELDSAQEKVNGLVALSGKAASNVAIAQKQKAKAMKEHLAKQEKVSIFVPLEGKEKLGAQLPVTLNGYRLNVPKGLYVKVPKQVAEIIMDSLNQTVEAQNIPQNLDLKTESDKERLA